MIARSHAAATVVLLAELLERAGLEAPVAVRAMAVRVLTEGGVVWC